MAIPAAVEPEEIPEKGEARLPSSLWLQALCVRPSQHVSPASPPVTAQSPEGVPGKWQEGQGTLRETCARFAKQAENRTFRERWAGRGAPLPFIEPRPRTSPSEHEHPAGVHEHPGDVRIRTGMFARACSRDARLTSKPHGDGTAAKVLAAEIEGRERQCAGFMRRLAECASVRPRHTLRMHIPWDMTPYESSFTSSENDGIPHQGHCGEEVPTT